MLWHPATGLYSRWMIVLPVLVSQIVVGSLYSWSIFNSGMDAVWGTTGQNAQAFTAGVGVFGLTTLLAGNWIERNGPFAAVAISTVCTPAGWALASLGSYNKNLPLVAAGFGIFHGVGAGMAYISTVSAFQKHFPEFKGIVSGLAVMGFGVGSFIWTTVGKGLLDPAGSYKWPAWQVQVVFAAVFLVALAIVLPFLRYPQPGFVPDTESLRDARTCKGAIFRSVAAAKSSGQRDREYSFIEATRTLEFSLLLVLVFGCFINGVVFLSSASDMVQNVFHKSKADADFLTSMLNLANFSGRFFWGLISDRMGRKNYYLLATSVTTFASGLMAVWVRRDNFPAWAASFLIIGSFYGGSFGVLPAFVSDLFGPKISGATHGVMIAVWALSAIVGIPIFSSFTSNPAYTYVTAAGKTIALPEAYAQNALWLCWLPLVAFFSLLFLNTRPSDRAMRRKQGGVRVRLLWWALVIRPVGDRLVAPVLGPHGLAEEWEDVQKSQSGPG